MEETDTKISLTPVPRIPGKPATMNFFTAIKKVWEGKRVTRISWGNNDYCIMDDGWLCVFTGKDNKMHTWNINDGDMEGEDWVLLSEAN